MRATKAAKEERRGTSDGRALTSSHQGQTEQERCHLGAEQEAEQFVRLLKLSDGTFAAIEKEGGGDDEDARIDEHGQVE